jgi:hypothetical protein
LRLFVNERNLKIDVVFKVLRAVVIRWFSLNEAPLGLFKFISDYLPYLEKINIFLDNRTNVNVEAWEINSIRLYTPCNPRTQGCVQPDWGYHNKKKFELIYKDWSKLFVPFIRNNLNQVVHTLAYAGYTVCTIWLRLFLHRSILIN